MISKNLKVEYLHPQLWRNLGIIIAEMHPLKQILFSYADGKGRRECLDRNGKPCGFTLEEEGFSEALFFQEHPEIEEVRFLTLEGIQNYYTRIQERKLYSQSIDEYQRQLYRIQKETKGIKIMTNPRIAYRCVWEGLEALLPKRNGILFLWIEKDEELFFNCILQFQNKELVNITTTDRYGTFYNQYEECRNRLRQEFSGTECCEYKMDLSEWQRRSKGWYYN